MTSLVCNKLPIRIQDLLKTSFASYANNTAIWQHDRKLKYVDLDRISDEMAIFLQSKYQTVSKQSQFPSESLIGICMPPSLEYYITVLAVLKCGCAFIPLDTTHPKEKITFVLSDSNPVYILTQPDYQHLVTCNAVDSAKIFVFDDVLSGKNFDQEKPKQEKKSNEHDEDDQGHYLSHLIYTSGSTGKPKGVLVEHAGVINCCLNRYPNVKDTDRLLQIAPIGFDINIAEWTHAFYAGATLCIPSGIEKLDFMVDRYKATNVICCPSLLATLLDPAIDRDTRDRMASLKNGWLVLGGESTTRNLLKRWQPYVGEIINGYGPTETTMYSHMRRFDSVNSELFNPKILGTPIINMKQHVLDDDGLEIKEPNKSGTLWLSGIGVSRGYKNLMDLNQSNFVKTFNSTMMYNTGDIVTLLANGDVVFEGRNDFQIKIGGRRVEIEGVENVFSRDNLEKEKFENLSDLKELCIMVFPKEVDSTNLNKILLTQEEKDQPQGLEIVLYFEINKSQTRINPSVMRDSLQDWANRFLRIEERPTTYIYLIDGIPLTVNDKMDRTALLSMYKRKCS